jgi:hypothetical protein
VNPRSLSALTFAGYRASFGFLFAQGLLCYWTILIALFRRLRAMASVLHHLEPDMHIPRQALILMDILVFVSFTLSPILGGVIWARGQRQDQAVQFLPLVLMVWFLIPLALELPPAIHKAAFVATCVIAVAYTSLSMLVGVSIVRDNLHYQGQVLAADVPLVDKLSAVRFVSEDWKAHSSDPRVPVDYDLGGKRWDYVTSFGRRYLKWYPAPYTLGRALDFTLLREHGLANAQEGVQLRSLETGRYLVTYSYKKNSRGTAWAAIREFEFGRWRDSILAETASAGAAEIRPPRKLE